MSASTFVPALSLSSSGIAALASLLLSLPALAQEGTSTPNSNGGGTDVPAAFQTYGSGCASSAPATGADRVVPSAYATTLGGTNNNIPFSWQPVRYQQVFLGSELSGAVLPWVAMGLRQASGFNSQTGQKVDLAIWLGGSTYDHTTLTNAFDNNFNSTSAPKTQVFKQRLISLPQMPPTAPTGSSPFFLQFPFDTLYVPTLGNDNLVVEVINYGNTFNNTNFTYPLDAVSNGTTTRLYASGSPTATTGTLGRNYGHIMAFRELGGTPRVPEVYNASLPVLGSDFHFGLRDARGNAPGAMIVGVSNSTSGGVPLPFSLAGLGAPGCQWLAATTIVLPITTNPGGDLAATISVPNLPPLDGFQLFVQFAVTDTVNPLGLVTSNGGQVTLGR